jgi:hypothetical protein
MQNSFTFSLSNDGGTTVEEIRQRMTNDLVDGFKRSISSRKSAEVAGDPGVSRVESAFADMAFEIVSEHAPELIKHRLGFQLLKKTDDENLLCGIFAFSVNSLLLYMPLFSINGEIRGYEMAYIPSRDRFIPANETWVNQLLSRSAIGPGEVEPRNPEEIRSDSMVMSNYSGQSLKLSSVSEILPKPLVDYALKTLFKQAAFPPSSFSPFYSALSASRERYKYAESEPIPSFDLFRTAGAGVSPDALLTDSFRAYKTAADWYENYPVFHALLDVCLPSERKFADFKPFWAMQQAAAETFRVRPVPQETWDEFIASGTKQAEAEPEPEQGFVRAVKLADVPSHYFSFVSESDLDQAHRDDGVLIDTRIGARTGGVLAGQDVQFSTPAVPGIYDVVLSDGRLLKCFVLFLEHARRFNGRYVHEYENDRSQDALVVSVNSGQTCKTELRNIYVARSYPLKKNWLKDLPEAGTGDSSVLATPWGFAWRGAWKKQGDDRYYDRDSRVTVLATGKNNSPYFLALDGGEYGDVHTVSCAENTVLAGVDPSDSNASDPLVLGNPEIWRLRFHGSAVSVTIKSNGTSGKYTINSELPQAKLGALADLMNEYDVDRKTAESLLELADAARPSNAEFAMRPPKRKTGESLVRTRPVGISIPNRRVGRYSFLGIPMTTNQRMEIPIPGQRMLRRDPLTDNLRGYPKVRESSKRAAFDPEEETISPPDDRRMQNAVKAQQAGQRDFVSAHMLMSLLREVDSEDILPKHADELEKAVDTLGRLYMQILWRYKTFQERFGRVQLEEFLELLVSLFQQMGDFICFLRRRSLRQVPSLISNE